MAQASVRHQGCSPTHATAAAARAAAPGDDRFCVWIHARCCKFQPRSGHSCRGGCRDFLLLTDALAPRSCRSWRALQIAHSVPSRDSHRNGVCPRSLRQTVERQLSGVFLRAASEVFIFSSAAAAVEALHAVLQDAEPPVAVLHVL